MPRPKEIRRKNESERNQWLKEFQGIQETYAQKDHRDHKVYKGKEYDIEEDDEDGREKRRL